MKTVIDRLNLAERWDVSVETIRAYERDGVITRLPRFPAPRYSLKEVEEIENNGRDNLMIAKNKEIQELKMRNAELEQKIERIKGVISI